MTELPDYHKKLLALAENESKNFMDTLNNRWNAVMGDVTELSLSEAYDVYMKRYTKGQKRTKAENELMKVWRARYEEIAKRTPCWDEKGDVAPAFIQYIPSYLNYSS